MKTLGDFFRKVDVGDCWEWTGARNSSGYGQFWTGPRTGPVAHRWLWEQIVGSIPDGLQLDHLCRNRACVNPDHLEPVTPSENVRRGAAPAAANAAKVRCAHGHPLSGANLYVAPKGYRRCRVCTARLRAEYRERVRAAA